MKDLYHCIGEETQVQFHQARPNHVGDYASAEIYFGKVNQASAVDTHGKLQVILRR